MELAASLMVLMNMPAAAGTPAVVAGCTQVEEAVQLKAARTEKRAVPESDENNRPVAWLAVAVGLEEPAAPTRPRPVLPRAA